MLQKVILFITLFSSLSISQQFSNWHNYSDMKNIESIAVSDSAIMGATDGGGFFYNISDNSFKTFHRTDGLEGVSLTSVTVDKSGKIWFGSNSGIIDVYNPETNDFKTILDIYNSDKSSKRINGLSSSGDTIIVSTDFGISLINANNYFFFDTFFKFGNFPANIKVNSSLKTTVLYACTDRGVAIQKAGATNLSAPESWNVYTTGDGLPSNNIRKIISFNGSIITATANGLGSFNGTSWLNYIPELKSMFINDIFPEGDSLFIVTNNNYIYLYRNNILTQLLFTQDNISTINYSSSEGILAGTNKGILKLSDNSFIYPNGPQANLFPSMAVDANENLWSASGTDVSGVGFYKFDGTDWFNYNTSNTQELPTNFYHTVYVSPDNTIYLGSWGQGFITISPDGTITNYNGQNTGMQGINTNVDFLVINGFHIDSKNNLWVLNHGAIDRKILSMEDSEKQWTHFSVPPTGTQYNDKYFNLAIDQYNTKWFCSQAQSSRQGLYFFNEGNSTSSSQDDVYEFITTPDINNNFVSSIKVDRRGDVWVGTGLGVNIITNTYSITTGIPKLIITSVFSLRQQSVTALAVDPLNQKWVGTNQGLILVNSDGTSLLTTLNTTNSPLPSNQITSLAIDENTGTVYVGTDKGLTSFVTTAVKPKEAFDELTIYPNPLLLNSNSNLVTIDGLIRDTDIKILTISGKLVKEYSSPGGRVAVWDGRDDFGKLVPSGVYFIVAFDKEGNSVAKGKIAVLKGE